MGNGITKAHSKNKIVIFALFIALLITIVIGTSIGSVNIPFLVTVKIILKNWGIKGFNNIQDGYESIIYYVRFPRVLLAAIVGSALAVSGAVMQAIFRNPMADPGIIGVSSGASLGAVIAIAVGIAGKGIFFMPLFASTGAILASIIIFVIASRGGKISTVNLILSGLAVSMFLGAITSLILMFIRGDQVKQFIFWTIGSLNARGWDDIKISIIPITISLFILVFLSKNLNIMLLGEEQAQAVGLDPMLMRKIAILFSSLATAAAVCVSGTISFVGLIVPHILRLILGSDHRLMLPASMLGGAVLLVVCDLIGRIVLVPQEIGVGIVTSLLGAPYFLFLLNKNRKGEGMF